jgi:hypothetical protein
MTFFSFLGFSLLSESLGGFGSDRGSLLGDLERGL